MVSKKRAAKVRKKKKSELEAAANNEVASDDALPEEKAATETESEEQPQPAAPIPEPPPQPLSNLFKMRQMPWWLVFLVGVYLIIKLQAVYDSPCSVLGLQSPVSRRDAQKAYRKASMCTHPDKLINAGKIDKQRGQILFTRATEAREAIVEALRQSKSKKISCFGKGGPFAAEAYAAHGLYALFFTAEGWQAMPMIAGGIGKFFYELVTFEAGFLTSFGVMLVLYQFFGYAYACCSHSSEGGLVRAILRAVTMLIFGPLPTATHFFIAPLVRWKVYISKKIMVNSPPDEDIGENESASGPTTADQVLGSATDISNKATVVGGVRRRKKTKKASAHSEEEQAKYSLVGKLASGKMAPDMHSKIVADGEAEAEHQISGDQDAEADSEEDPIDPQEPVSIFKFLRSVLLLDMLVELVSIKRLERAGWRKNRVDGMRVLEDPLQARWHSHFSVCVCVCVCACVCADYEQWIEPNDYCVHGCLEI